MKIIKLTKGMSTVVDDEDFLDLHQFSWYVLGHPGKEYAARYGGTTEKGTIHLRMHRLILDAPQNMEVDHINGNRLDNRRCNLRLATRSENGRNRGKNKSISSSKFKGVTYHSRDQCWQAYIIVNKQKYHLGYFKSEIEAACAYNKAATQMHGAFAKLNDLSEEKQCQQSQTL